MKVFWRPCNAFETCWTHNARTFLIAMKVIAKGACRACAKHIFYLKSYPWLPYSARHHFYFLRQFIWAGLRRPSAATASFSSRPKSIAGSWRRFWACQLILKKQPDLFQLVNGGKLPCVPTCPLRSKPPWVDLSDNVYCLTLTNCKVRAWRDVAAALKLKNWLNLFFNIFFLKQHRFFCSPGGRSFRGWLAFNIPHQLFTTLRIPA